MLAAVIFDLDDTLYPEIDFVRSGFVHVGAWCRQQLGISGVGDLALKLFCEGRRGDIFNAALEQLGRPQNNEVITRLVTEYREHRPDIILPPDTVQCMEKLQGKWRLGLLTDGSACTQWNKIRALGLEPYFEGIIVTSELGTGFSKPHERGFVNLEERFNASGPELVYVADNPRKDFITPSIRGWHSVRVKREGGLYSQIPMEQACHSCIQDLLPLPDLVQGL